MKKVKALFSGHSKGKESKASKQQKPLDSKAKLTPSEPRKNPTVPTPSTAIPKAVPVESPSTNVNKSAKSKAAREAPDLITPASAEPVPSTTSLKKELQSDVAVPGYIWLNKANLRNYRHGRHIGL
jgi:hypothetical protein